MPVVDRSGPVTTSEQQAVPVAQEDQEAARKTLATSYRDRGMHATAFEIERGDWDHTSELRALVANPVSSQPCKSGEGAGQCPALPDHADIKETIEDAADDWQAKGYTSALAEVRDMAAVGRSLMEALPKGYCYMDSPAEIVSDLQNDLDEARGLTAIDATQTREAQGAWLPISDDAKSGAMVELVVDYSDGDHPLADGVLACTVGFNTLADTGEDEWKFAGWCWTHDHFVQGKGTPVAWRPSRLNATDDGLPALPARDAA